MSLCRREPATVAMADIISILILLTLKSKTISTNGNITKVKQCSVACARRRTSPDNNVKLFGDWNSHRNKIKKVESMKIIMSYALSLFLGYVREATHAGELLFRMHRYSQIHLHPKIQWTFSKNSEYASIVLTLLKVKHNKYYLTGRRNFPRIEGNKMSALFVQEL